MTGEHEAALYLVATPIGNLEDMTYRAVRVLREVDVIAAEDTRKARILLDHYGIKTRTISFFEGNEARRSAELVRDVAAGKRVAVISEAGLPGISDPGARLVRAAIEANLRVDVIPGASAVTTAVVLSGFGGEPEGVPGFCWLGFVPRKGRARRELLERVASSDRPAVLFEAPGRLGRTLAELAEVAGSERRAAVCRELTKRFQEIQRSTLGDLAARYAETPPRGEITLVVDAAASGEQLDGEALQEAVRARVEAGDGPREIADALKGLAPRRRVYQLALELSGRKK
ncbi:MAG: 16S rRNA (cytidine(1402)-2'-O)-methyltransferase [Myxococcales bacterium]|nr:16S rRNA (cytidine(1402)-2'-O)-methyltransferase [Myxococcales bacterium]